MGLLTNISQLFTQKTESPVMTKAPGFNVTQFSVNNPFANLISPETNYFEQYILYTSKCIDYLSSKVASSKIELKNQSDKPLVDSQLWKDLEAFNPYMNLWEARKLVIIHKFLTGAAYWYIDRKPEIPGQKVAFYPLDPTNVQLKTDARGLPSEYVYKDGSGQMVNLDVNDVIYFRRMNPSNWFEGQSIVKEMQFWVNAYAQGAQYNMNKLGNNINLDKILVFEGVGDEAKAKVEAQLANKYGGPKNAGKLGVLNRKPEVISINDNQKDLDYVEGMRLLRQDILIAFGIPEALFIPSATNSNTKEATKLFQSDTLEPLLQQEKAVLNEQLIPKYKITGSVYFDFENVVDEDKAELVDQAARLYESGIYTKNQALEYIGDEPVKDGDTYKTESAPQQDPNVDPIIKGIKEKSQTLADRLDEIIKKQELDEMMVKSIKMADEQEGIMYQSAETLFQDQFKRAIDYINKTESPTVRGIFNTKEEIEITKQIFKESYAKIIANSNDVGNVEIKQKFFKNSSPKLADYKVKSISGDAIQAIANKLEYFSKEVSETTRDKLRKLMADGLENGFDTELFTTSIENLFNQFIDGQENINVLTKINSYVPSISVGDNNEPITNTGNRYRTMLASITKQWGDGDITKSERDEALMALRGLIDPSDSVGKEVDALLSSVYQINKEVGITRSRAVTIARTEATFARNLGFDDVYSNNPFVTGKTWVAAGDKDTRDSHAALNGTTVGIGKPFQSAGGKMMFPGDTSLGAGAEEIVNCRCRIKAEVE